MHINNTGTFIKNFFTAKENKTLWSKIILVVQTGLFWNCILPSHKNFFLVFKFFLPFVVCSFLNFLHILYLVGNQFKVSVRWNIKCSFLFLIKWKFLKRDFFSYISQALLLRFVVVSLDVGPLSKGLEQKVMHKIRRTRANHYGLGNFLSWITERW